MLKLGKYRHFKGGEYEVVGLVKHSETLEEMVLYKHFGQEELWVRPLAMFTEEVERDGQKMPRFEYIGDCPKKYNKLIRDNIAENIIKHGGQVVFHVANEEEFWKKLNEKLLEEANEFVVAKTDDERIEEMGDLFEVINKICAYKKLSHDSIETVMVKKAAKKGKFEKRIILEQC